MRLRTGWATLALVLLGLGSTVTNLGNHFSQDDMPVIEKNPLVHSIRDPGSFFTQAYWPKPFSPALYRPLATTSFAVQWVLGGGRPWVFRAVSILLYLAGGLALYSLACRFLPPFAAWLAAAFFLVNPVHVEAVAVAVNQSELWVGLIACLIVLQYLRIRATGRFGLREGAILFGLYLVATLFKETGLVLIGLIVAAELIEPHPEPLAKRLTAIRPLLLVMLLGAASFFAIRTLALEGDPVGTFTAEALDGLSMGQRALTMLAVVPEWFRLLLWPAHLQADYSPREINSATTWGMGQTAGALLIALTVLVIVASWRKNPAVTFGLLFAAIGIFPVSNVLVPTGIALAERTLYLPSIGMMLAVGGLAVPVIAALGRQPRAVRGLAVAGLLAILGMGVSRSASRQRVWQDQFTLWYQTTIDAPSSYRSHHALAQLLYQVGSRRWAEREYKLAIALYPKQWGAYFDLANKLRLTGLCEPAVRYYRQTLLIEPEQESARTGLIACLLHLGRYADARAEAREGMGNATRPGRLRLFQMFFRVADSAATARAAPGTVTLSIASQDTMP